MVASAASCEDFSMETMAWLMAENWQTNLARFGGIYGEFHVYFAIIVCVFGIAANVVFLVILLHKTMDSPVSTILTSIACCDTCLMTSYLVWLLNHNGAFAYLGQKDCDQWSEDWARFSLFHANFSVYLHTASLWQTVLLACVRWYCLRKRNSFLGPNFITKTRLFILGTYIFVAAQVVPNTLSWTYTNGTHTEYNCTLYDVVASELSLERNCVLRKLNWWIGGICHKFIPCCVLSVFMGLLVHVMFKTKGHRKRLLRGTTTQQNKCDRTTIMLILIVFIFWLTELPQGILTILTGYFGMWFRLGVYKNLGDLFDDLSLVNSSMNFCLYCVMSAQFRHLFIRTFSSQSQRRTTGGCQVLNTELRTPLFAEQTRQAPVSNELVNETAVPANGVILDENIEFCEHDVLL